MSEVYSDLEMKYQTAMWIHTFCSVTNLHNQLILCKHLITFFLSGADTTRSPGHLTHPCGMVNLLELPQELLENVFGYLSPADKRQCMYINGTMHLYGTRSVYQHIRIPSTKVLDLFIDLFRNASLNCGKTSRDYGQYVTKVKVLSSIAPENVLALVRYYPNLVDLTVSSDRNANSDDNIWPVELQKCCPKLQRLDCLGHHLPFKALDDGTQDLCKQLVSLGLIGSGHLSTISPSLYFPNLSEIKFGVHKPHHVQQLRSVVGRACSTLITLGICWTANTHGSNNGDNDITQLLLDCPHLSTLALEWDGCDLFQLTRFPDSLSELQLLCSIFSDMTNMTDALLQTSNIKRLHFEQLPISLAEVQAIHYANKETLEAFTYSMCNYPNLTESCLAHCMALRSLSLRPIVPEKEGGVVGRLINSLFREQLESLDNVYDEPCFYETQWSNIKALTITMKTRSALQSRIQRLAIAFPNVEYLKIESDDKQHVTVDDWNHLIPHFQHLKGLHLRNKQAGSINEVYSSAYYQNLKCAYEVWEDDQQRNSNFCCVTQPLISYLKYVRYRPPTTALYLEEA